ncbi:periplasmic heavy metal sensor [Chitinophaga lutea]|uniref:Periplasmic heavy metal sensor n=1 Tax=Chitinophaga lutea TaxID=2488634 RepID=A0A3N4PME6_9BACT|nr:periplasmic heavy metal sensor [Chitinophaga lutea]RPE08975.1 periplasmic heavy metal sensor [Chitinophaga lutea]
MKETFARNKVLSLLVLVLLLTNILMLVFFVWMKPEPKHAFKRDSRGDVMQVLEKEVGFSPAQMDQYKKLKDQHWDRMKPYFGEMRTARNNFYNLLNQASVPDSTVQRLADSIAAKQKQMDLQTFRHFEQVKAICTPEQQPRFDSLVQQVIKKMGGRRSQAKEDSVKH